MTSAATMHTRYPLAAISLTAKMTPPAATRTRYPLAAISLTAKIMSVCVCEKAEPNETMHA